MTPREIADLQRQNLYLLQRNSQLQADIADLSAEDGRLREERERLHGRVGLRAANPLSGGQ